MRKIYYLSHSSHEEVIFRSEADINYSFNCFALACLETESRPLADSEMTTHLHFGAAMDSPSELFSRYRCKYSRYFNSKYKRSGRLGDRNPFVLEVDGLLHCQTMLSYIYRQGLHHGLSPSSFGYKHNSINVIFREELGKSFSEEVIPRSRMSQFLPHGSLKDVPEGYRMNKNGLLLREDVIDTHYVEEIFISPRNFLYQVNRLSNEKWREEQAEDNNGLPSIGLADIEPPCFQPSMSQLLVNENGRSVRNGITDLELCDIIDNRYVARFSGESLYDLPATKRKYLGNKLYSDIRSGEISRILGRDAGLPDVAQIRRCAAIE